MNNSKNFQLAQKEFSYSQQLRRDFHKNPELGFQEFRTSEIVANQLTEFGFSVQRNVGKTGVVGVIEGNMPGPVLILRFDMDALPIQEANKTDYVSLNQGVMHACGHDGHTSIGLTIAKIISQNLENVKGTLKFLFQPAEEGLGGALAVIEDGVLQNPKPDYCLGLHIWNDKEVGWVGVNSGPMMAGADTFTLNVIGKGGHGGLPNLAVDPIVAAANIINGVQSIVSRNVSPLEQAVVSFCSINGGSTFNVIPDKVQLTGTIRTFDRKVRETVVDRLKTISANIANGMGCEIEFELNEITPAVVNSPDIASILKEITSEANYATDFVGNFQTMGSEDFSLYLNEVPGCFFFVGSANHSKGLSFGHHHPKFDFDEAALPIGVSLMLEMIEKIGQKQ
jgi:amidohydrolase